MTRFSAGLAVVLLAYGLLAETGATPAADAFAVDPVHSSVVFKIQHVGISWIHGRFNDVSGEFLIDKQAPASSSFALTIKAASIDTNNAKRDEHLRSPDFFNVKQYPLLSFKSTSVKPVEGGYEVAGDLTMHGVTKPVTLVLHGGKEIEFPKGKKRTGFSTAVKLKRTDFGMEKFVGMLGDDVHVEAGVEAVEK
jgi:polyisoprenoid-binding protein YceI